MAMSAVTGSRVVPVGRRPEVQGHAAVALVEPDALVIREDPRGAEPLHGGPPQREMRAAAMDAHLGDRVACGPPPRLGIDELAKAV
jgi:hypothetical protein